MGQRTCSVEGCERRHQAKGLCKYHYQRDWRARHPDEAHAQNVEWYQKNRDRHLATSRAWADANREHKNAVNKKWMQENKVRFNASRRAFRKNNPELTATRYRAEDLWRKYRLRPADYDAMLAAQGGRCAICGGTRSRRLSVDHCHDTGQIRALLCGPCNAALGHLQHSPHLLRLAAEYLESHAAPAVRSAAIDVRVVRS